MEKQKNEAKSGYPQESAAMIIAALGMEKIAWSLRRLHCPVADDALVLEVGSGEIRIIDPMFCWMPMKKQTNGTSAPGSGRPSDGFAFAEKCPSRTRFDFVIAS